MRRGGVVPPAHVALRAEGRRMRRPYCLRASLIVCAKMNHRILIGPRIFIDDVWGGDVRSLVCGPA